jgi:hypothetical protein
MDSCYGFLLTGKKVKKKKSCNKWLRTDVGTDEQQADV